eukprot:Lithocolla_globosa_v1_NODE_7522_length_935_cov_14.888636.p1 type:complete len:297 gc:universal NODE_7522_length_935_cov_14.888636:892-2(-)
MSKRKNEEMVEMGKKVREESLEFLVGDSPTVKMLSSDGRLVTASKEISDYCETIRNMTTSSTWDVDVQVPVPLPGSTLAKIFNWCKNHYDYQHGKKANAYDWGFQNEWWEEFSEAAEFLNIQVMLKLFSGCLMLESSDGQIFVVEKDVAFKMGLVSDLFGALGLGLVQKVWKFSQKIPLPNVTSLILAKVIEYCVYHRDDPPPDPEDEMRERRTDDISTWDQEYCKVDQGTLFELILAANYLNIKPLTDLACRTVANMIKGKDPDEIRKTFGIKNDFTPEEEEQIRRENEWCEDRP